MDEKKDEKKDEKPKGDPDKVLDLPSIESVQKATDAIKRNTRLT
jgi:hypothetical protein